MNEQLMALQQMLNDVQQRINALSAPAPASITFTVPEALVKLSKMYLGTSNQTTPSAGSWYLLVQDEEGPGVHLREAKYATYSRMFPQYVSKETAEAAVNYMGGEDVIVAIAHALGGK